MRAAAPRGAAAGAGCTRGPAERAEGTQGPPTKDAAGPEANPSLAAQGIVVNRVSVQNESQWAESFNSCLEKL